MFIIHVLLSNGCKHLSWQAVAAAAADAVFAEASSSPHCDVSPRSAQRHCISASSQSSLSPRSCEADDIDDTLIDLTSPQMSPLTDFTVTDDGEILFVGPNFTGTRPCDSGTFGEFRKQPHNTVAAADLTVADDQEILLVGHNFTATQPVAGGTKFGQFPAEIGIQSMKNPFLVDILASSRAGNMAVSNGVGLLSVEDQLVECADDGPDTGAALTQSPVSLRTDQSVPSFSTRPLSDRTQTSRSTFCADDVSCESELSAVSAGASRTSMPAADAVSCDIELLSVTTDPLMTLVVSYQLVIQPTLSDGCHRMSVLTRHAHVTY